MRKLRTLWRSALSPRVWEELETWIGVMLFLGAAVLLFVTLKAQAAYADEFPQDVRAPTLLFHAADGGCAAAALQTDLRTSVAGVVARVRVAQRFRNTSGSHVEAVYALPLPDDAAVDRLVMQVGDRVIESEIHERQTADRLYGEARAAGQRASLVRQTSANLFTTAVANIAPGETIDITIEYLQTARYGAFDTPEGSGALDSALPAGTTGLESPVAAGWRSTPWHEAYVRAVLAPGMPLEWIGSRSHEITAIHEQGTSWSTANSGPVAGGAAAAGVLVQPPPADLYVLASVAPRVPMDRDLVVAWRPRVGVAPAVAALTETVGETTYALLMILPPSAAHTARSQPREQLYVIDTSGSMAGQSIVQAKAALLDALEHHLVSPYTSLVAVDQTLARAAAAPLDRSNVGNAPPAGAQYTLALPQTATPAPLLRSVGALALLLAAACALAGLRSTPRRPS